MHFTKTLALFLAPVALAAEAATSATPSVVHKTLTLVPSGYTPPPTSTPTSTPHSSTPYHSSSVSRTLVSTPLPKVTSAAAPVEHNAGTSPTAAASASTSAPPTNGASRQIPGAVAAGALAVAGLLMV